jgi:hypothetical protein
VLHASLVRARTQECMRVCSVRHPALATNMHALHAQLLLHELKLALGHVLDSIAHAAG